jgi:hypothetical protein
MNIPRPGTAGATRVCPHCKATVLESAAICPGCRHHLRFNVGASHGVASEGYSALNIDGTIAPKETGEPCEYCVVLDIRDERGQQVMRQVVSVGVLRVGEARRVNVSVEMLPVRTQAAARAQAAATSPSTSSAPTPLGQKAPTQQTPTPQVAATKAPTPQVATPQVSPKAPAPQVSASPTASTQGLRRPR